MERTDIDKEARYRLTALDANAKAKTAEGVSNKRENARDKDWHKRNGYVSTAPIYIASSEDVGTNRVRANHVDAAIDYFEEQEKLKKMNAPIA
jgi:hypothetical protein